MNPSGQDVWVHVEHLQGVVAGHTFELLGRGRELAGALGGRLVAVLAGSAVQVQASAPSLGAADSVLCFEDEELAGFTPDSHAAVLRALAAQSPPRLMLFGATSMGMDLAAILAATLAVPLVVNCTDIRVEDGRIVATSQMCGGKLLAEVEASGAQVVLTVLPGAFPAEKGASDRVPAVERVPLPVPREDPRMRVLRMLEPAAGDVDITKVPVLVAVGRGIQRSENLPLVEELAGLLGGAVCASRPVVDQGWMPRSRQVGKSGMTVKPKLYLALGISGAPEHAEGMKGSELIVAINSDPKAPIFNVAHYGAAADMFDIIPCLTDQLRQRKVAA